jgi:predicted extracellular nuclease
VLAVPIAVITPTVASAVTGELLISEYIEGTSNNKAIEIYNGTGAAVDLAAGGYSIAMYFNGSSAAGLTVGLTGTVADGDVYVLAQSSASATILAQADQTNGSGWFNGDDAVVLSKGAVVIDSIGQVGFDPGSEWGAGLVSTQDNTLRRKADVCAGDTNTGDPFEPVPQWDGFATDTFDGLGSHTAACGGPGGGGTPEVVISEIMYNPASAEDDWEWVEIVNIGDGPADLGGWVIDDINAVAHGAANIATGTVPAGGSAILYNADDISAGDFADAWGSGANLIAVTGWSAMALNNGGDTIGLWSDFASYVGDNTAQVNAVESVTYDDVGPWPSDDGSGSIYLTDLAADRNDGANWALSTVGAATPVNDAYQSVALGGNGGNDIGSPSADPPTIEVDPIGDCADPATPIHAIQGSGAASADVGNVREIQGVVVGDFQDGVAGTSGDLNGFFVQEEDGEADGDATTSEGIFVFDGSNPAVDVSVGGVVRVRGSVAEFGGKTEITNVLSVIDCAVTGTASAVSLSLPVAAVDDFEAYEGMYVTFPEALVISEYFNFDRFGEIVLTSQRNLTPTAEFEPGPAAIAAAADFLLDRITLDDGRSNQNPDPAIHPNGAVFDLDNLFRGGDTVADVTGVIDYSFGLYRVQPTQGAVYTNANPRTAAPDPVGGDLTVSSFNVLNYFTTLDNSGPICGPLADQDCRGADDAGEFTRQRDKIVAAITTIDADIVGLTEIENNATDFPTADLVAGLNAVAGAGTYDYVATGAIGGDAIRVAIVYQPASVTPTGAYAVLDSSVDPRFDDTRNRPMLVQSFEENATGAVFTVAVNHLKSKGSACAPDDPDTGDGAGNCNLTRTNAAQAISDFLATDPTGSGDQDVLVIGDLNSYDKEDPIDALTAAGYTDLVFQYGGEDAYSYVFDGQTGYLDYQLANGSLAPQVTGATVWHINADEPDLIDYDTSFKRPAQDAIYAPDAYRSSDHDPVIVGLDPIASAFALKETARDQLASLLPSGSSSNDRRIRKAIASIDQSLDPDLWIDGSYLDGEDGDEVFKDEKKAAKELMKVRGASAGDAAVAVELLLTADDQLANSALEVAINSGGDARDIAKARSELAKAAADVAAGRFDKAIDHYRKAWEYAIDAVENTRFATFNASLNRFNEGDLAAELASPGSPQPATIAEIIQRTRPEVLLINEFDYDAGGVAAAAFQRNYLSVSQNGADPIAYPFRYVAPSNTGIPSGLDLDNSGGVGGPNDAFGFGFFPGQFGMVVYSQHPIDVGEIRTFQNFLWKDMPGALLPDDPTTPAPNDWYSPAELDVFRLSSKSHWDVPISIGDRTVHFLVSHPTPPVFDGPEDRNGTRNFDEIRFWADYVSGGHTASYIYDDAGHVGGLAKNDRFVIAGDQNSDPLDGDSIPGAIQQLLNHPTVNTEVTPTSLGGPEAAVAQGGANTTHLSDPKFDTADFADSSPGNLRADYVLPSKRMQITDAAVFWPLSTDPLWPLVGNFPFPSSDHKLVWIDVDVDGGGHDHEGDDEDRSRWRSPS